MKSIIIILPVTIFFHFISLSGCNNFTDQTDRVKSGNYSHYFTFIFIFIPVIIFNQNLNSSQRYFNKKHFAEDVERGIGKK